MKQNLANRLAGGGVWALQVALASVEIARRLHNEGHTVPIGSGSPSEVFAMCGAGAFEHFCNVYMDGVGQMKVIAQRTPEGIRAKVVMRQQFLPNFYDRHGTQISAEDWQELRGNPEYRRIAFWRADNGSVGVSTVWMGFDPNGCATPHVFETCVVHVDGNGQPHVTFQSRTDTEGNAKADHDKVVALVQGGKL